MYMNKKLRLSLSNDHDRNGWPEDVTYNVLSNQNYYLKIVQEKVR